MEKMTPKQYQAWLIGLVKAEIDKGKTVEVASEVLSPKQYDYLIDHDIFLDEMFGGHTASASSVGVKKARSKSPNGYNKKYPADKMALYNGICEYLASIGATIEPMAKCNYRDIDFTIGETKHKIVLSNPRK